MTAQPVDIAHLIQVALTPIFLISAIGVTLNVLTSRLARIVDRARRLEERVLQPDHAQDRRDIHDQLSVLARRSRWINAAITLITLSALFIALVVVMLFVNAFLRWELAAVIAGTFIMSMATLAAALLAFLIEVRIATTTLRIGLEVASRDGTPGTSWQGRAARKKGPRGPAPDPRIEK
jgi:membrane protein implicated in regulation of membrane protease activity